MNLLDALQQQLVPTEVIIAGMKSGKWTPAEVNAYLDRFEVPQVWDPINNAAKKQDIEEARKDSNAMIEQVLRDKEGKPFKQLAAHREIQRLLMQAFHAGLGKNKALQQILEGQAVNLMIEMPFESGKTQQLVGFLLWALGQNQNLTIAYVREAFDDATGIVGQIATIIQTSEEYHEIFPAVKLQAGSQRGIGGKKKSFTLERRAALGDPTLEAVGMDQSPEGKRWDLFIGDDIETRKTASSEALRQRGVEVFRHALKSRLDKNRGFYCILGQDRGNGVLEWIKGNERINHVHIPVMSDISDYSTCNFPEMYSERAIEELKADMTTFLLYYMLQKSDPEEQDRKRRAIQRAIDRAGFEGHRLYESYQPGPYEFVSVGIDVPVKKIRAGGKEADNLAAYVQTYNPKTGDQITIGMRMQKGGWFDIIEFLMAACHDYGLLHPGPRILIVENVQAQDYIIQAFNDPDRGIIKRIPDFRNLRIEPYTTSQVTKLYDIPAVMNAYHNGKEILPDSEITKSYVGGLMSWRPGDHPHDLLMARVCSDHGIELLRHRYVGTDYFTQAQDSDDWRAVERADYEPSSGHLSGDIAQIAAGVY